MSYECSCCFLEVIIPPQNIHCNTKWIQYALNFAGGCGEGYQLDQLHSPYGICIDDDDQIMYIADYGNDRIIKWKYGANYGQIAAGGNGKGCRRDQLNLPTDVIFDRKNDSLVICDAGNRRIVRWSRQTNKNQPAIISHIACSRLTIDVNGDLYVSDCEKHEVRRWREGEINDGTVVAGGNGKGDQMNQLNAPTYIFVDQDYSIYVSDTLNHRVMKWTKGAKEGMVVAGGQGEGNGLTQLCNPQGVIVDYLGNIYIADSWNHRVMRWSKGSRKGSIIVGGNGQGQQPDQISCPLGISFDREGSLYVVDWGNHRIQKFDVDLDID
jgi:sugar lactone lactonase YvrE